MTEITNVLAINAEEDETKAKKVAVVENLQLGVLALTIIGQVLVRFDLALTAQVLWMVANGIALGRDFYLHRPMADKVKNGALLALTIGLVVSILVQMFV